MCTFEILINVKRRNSLQKTHSVLTFGHLEVPSNILGSSETGTEHNRTLFCKMHCYSHIVSKIATAEIFHF